MKLLKELGNKFIDLYDSLTNADSSWNRQYDFYLIFGHTDENLSPWITNIWEADFEPYFNVLIKQAGNIKETGIKVIKHKQEKRVSKKDNGEFVYHSYIKHGRLKWDEESHKKWTIAYEPENYFFSNQHCLLLKCGLTYRHQVYSELSLSPRLSCG